MIDYGFGATYTLNDQFSGVADKIAGKFSMLEGVTDKQTAKINKHLNGIATGAVLTGAGAMMLAPLKQAVDYSSEFNAKMSEVGAVAGIQTTSKDFQGLKEQAMQLGSETAFTASEVASGMKFLQMAGFKVNETMSAMPGMLSLASAGNLDLGTSADIASNAMALYSMSADKTSKALEKQADGSYVEKIYNNADRMADVLAKASSSSNTSVQSLGQSIKYFAGSINTYKIPLEDSVAMMGLLGNAGLQGSVATASLSTAMGKLAKPTGDMKKLMKETGMQFFDAGGKFVGMSGMLKEYEKALEGKTEAEKSRIITTMVGSEASKNIMALLNAEQKDHAGNVMKGSKALEHYTEVLKKSGGAAQQMAETQLDNLQGDITKFQSAYEGMMIRIGDILEPILRKTTSFGNVIVTAFTEIINTPLGAFLVKTAGALGVLVTGVGLGVTAFHAFKIAQITVLPLIKAFGVSLKLAMLPMLKFALIGALLAGAFYGLKKSWESFTSVMNGGEVGTGIIKFGQRLGGIMQAMVHIFRTGTQEGVYFSESMDKAFKDLGIDGFVSSLVTYYARIRAFFDGIVLGAKSLYNSTLLPFWDAIKRLGNAIMPFINQAFDSFSNFLGLFGVATSQVSTFESVGRFVFDMLTRNIRLVVKGLTFLVKGFTGLLSIKTIFKGILEQATTTGYGLSSTMSKTLKNLGFLEFVENVGSYLRRAIEYFTPFYESIKNTFHWIKTKIINPFLDGFSKGFADTMGRFDKAILPFKKAFRKIEGWVNTVVMKSKKALNVLWSKIGEIAKPLVDSILKVSGKLSEFFGQFSTGEDSSSVITGFSELFSFLGTQISIAWNWLKEFTLKIFESDTFAKILSGTGQVLFIMLSAGFQTVIFLITAFVEGLIYVGKQIWTIGEVFYDVFSTIWTQFDLLRNGFISFPEFFINIGVGIVDALGKGLKSAWSNFVDLLMGLVDALPFAGEIKDFFGIKDTTKNTNASVSGLESPQNMNWEQSLNPNPVMGQAQDNLLQTAQANRQQSVFNPTIQPPNVQNNFNFKMELDGDELTTKISEKQELNANLAG